jgi:hypothetical protein
MRIISLSLFTLLFLLPQIGNAIARPTPPVAPRACNVDYNGCYNFCMYDGSVSADMCRLVCSSRAAACECLNNANRTPACSACVTECRGNYDDEQINCIGGCLNRAGAAALEQR